MFWIIASILIVTVAAAGLLVRRGDKRVSSFADIVNVAVPVDMEAFRLLLDSEETAFLRSRLTGRSFRRVQRVRLRAALAYTLQVATNASIMIRACQLSGSSAERSVSSTELLNAALLLRLRSSALYVRLATHLVWPGLQSPGVELVEAYSGAKNLFLRVVSENAPASASALYASV